MLSIMRRQAGSWIIKVLLFAIVVVFIFWGVGSMRSRDENKVADVNGQIVTYDEYSQAYDRMREQYRRAYGNAFNEEMFKGMKLQEQALDQVINRILMMQEANRLSIQVADETLDKAIAGIPAFQKNGIFDETQANIILSQNKMGAAEFRNNFRQDMIINKVRALVLDGLTVVEAEAKDWYDWYNAEVDLNYILLPAARYNDISLSAEEITEYFKPNENNYRTELQVKVNFLLFDPTPFKSEVQISKEQIAEYYNGHLNEFKTEKMVEARHILLRLDEDADAATVAAKEQEALKIYKLAQAGQSFEALAKQHSEDSSKDQGGFLGAFKKDMMVKPFADKAFSMKAGQISEPVRTQFGWHIIKVEKINEAKELSLDAAATGISVKLLDQSAKALAQKKAESIYDNLYDGDDLAAAAKTNQMEIRTTDFFTRQTFKDKAIGNTELFAEKAFGLSKMAISEVLDVENGYCLLQVVDRVEPAVPALDTVIDRVRADLLKKRQDERAKSDAQACLAELQKGTSLADAAARYGSQPMPTGYFKRSGSIPKIGYDPQLSEAAFKLQAEKPLPEQVFKGQQGWYVIQLKERKPPASDDFAKQKDALITRLTEQKKQSAAQQWLTDLRARGKVSVNQKLIQ